MVSKKYLVAVSFLFIFAAEMVALSSKRGDIKEH